MDLNKLTNTLRARSYGRVVDATSGYKGPRFSKPKNHSNPCPKGCQCAECYREPKHLGLQEIWEHQDTVVTPIYEVAIPKESKGLQRAVKHSNQILSDERIQFLKSLRVGYQPIQGKPGKGKAIPTGKHATPIKQSSMGVLRGVQAPTFQTGPIRPPLKRNGLQGWEQWVKGI